jgi:hypothetical protein
MNNPTSGGNGHKFSVDELNKALLDIEDKLQRCLLPFVVLDTTAEDIYHERLLGGDKVVVGVEKKHLTKEAIGTLKTLLRDLVPDPIRSFSYKVDKVPVYIKVINRKYSFLKHKDFKFYYGSEYKVPNPFAQYWKVRGLVR